MIITQKMRADAEWTSTEKKVLESAAQVLADAVNVLDQSDCKYYVGGLDTAFRREDLLALHDKLIMLTEVHSAKGDTCPWS